MIDFFLNVIGAMVLLVSEIERLDLDLGCLFSFRLLLPEVALIEFLTTSQLSNSATHTYLQVVGSIYRTSTFKHAVGSSVTSETRIWCFLCYSPSWQLPMVSLL